MRTLLKLLSHAARKWFSLIVVAALPAVTGCGPLDREKDGDKEPVSLAEYVVTVSPQSRTLVLTPQSTIIPISVEIAGACVGDLIPPECENFHPLWVVSTFHSTLVSRVTFDNEESPRTIAHIFFVDGVQLIPTIGFFDSRFDISAYITFYTKRELRGVGHRRSRARLDLKLQLPKLVPAQEEGSPTEERVTVAPTRLSFELSRTQPSAEQTAVIRYTGPVTTLRVDGPYDSDGALSGSATKFIVLNPTTVETTLAGNATITLIVYFQVPLDDFNFYGAYLKIRPTKGSVVEVKLKGHRNPF